MAVMTGPWYPTPKMINACEHKELPHGPKQNEIKPCNVSTCDKAYNYVQLFKMHTETYTLPK